MQTLELIYEQLGNLSLEKSKMLYAQEKHILI